MAKHKLYRQLGNTSPLTSSLCKEISPARDVHPSTSDTVTLVRYNMVESKCADKSVTNEKSANVERVTTQKTNTSFSDPLPGGVCASDSDSDDSLCTFSGSGTKLPYSAKEDEWILKFVLRGQNVFKVGSISLWKHLESKKENPKRTYQSLKNRFMRGIRPHIFTRYSHLLKSDTEIKRVLAKFPELKCKVGRTNTLSRIQLPPRYPNSKSAVDGLANGSRDNDERVASPKTSTSDTPLNGSGRREPILNLHHFSNFQRNVKIRDKSLAVSVNFSSKKQSYKPLTPSIGIYETYKKFKKKNKLVLCSACGRYNQPKKNKLDSSGDGESLNFSAGSDILVGNSLGADAGKPSVTNSGRPSAKRRKMEESEPRPCPLSPSLLKDTGEERGVPVGSGAPDESLETSEVVQARETSNSVALGQEADSEAADQLREADDDLESTYEDTVTDFKKLIKNEEERLLVKRCLGGKGRELGLSDSISQMSMESYFVELSPNLETPQLTEDYSNQVQTQNSEKGNSSSLLARNMMKMLEESKTSKES